jgi:hypothetical protein
MCELDRKLLACAMGVDQVLIFASAFAFAFAFCGYLLPVFEHLALFRKKETCRV